MFLPRGKQHVQADGDGMGLKAKSNGAAELNVSKVGEHLWTHFNFTHVFLSSSSLFGKASQLFWAKPIPTGLVLVIGMKHGAWIYSHSIPCSVYNSSTGHHECLCTDHDQGPEFHSKPRRVSLLVGEAQLTG